jgi:hypothetical protein
VAFEEEEGSEDGEELLEVDLEAGESQGDGRAK